jgi:hypothetical protein
VRPKRKAENRFNGFSPGGKPLKRLAHRRRFNTRLKPGANESEAFLLHPQTITEN